MANGAALRPVTSIMTLADLAPLAIANLTSLSKSHNECGIAQGTSQLSTQIVSPTTNITSSPVSLSLSAVLAVPQCAPFPRMLTPTYATLA